MSHTEPAAPSDHLLRTLAAVPVSSQILDFGCGFGRHTEPLLRLGFPVHACDPRPDAVEATRGRVHDLIGENSVETMVQVTPLDGVDYPEETFNWIVADRAETYATSKEELQTVFEEGRRLLKPGGWLYVTVPASPDDHVDGTGFSIEIMETLRKNADLAEATEPERVEEVESGPRLRAIYRCVEPRTSA